MIVLVYKLYLKNIKKIKKEENFKIMLDFPVPQI